MTVCLETCKRVKRANFQQAPRARSVRLHKHLRACLIKLFPEEECRHCWISRLSSPQSMLCEKRQPGKHTLFYIEVCRAEIRFEERHNTKKK